MEQLKKPYDIETTYKTAAFVALIIFVIGFVVGFAVSRKYSPSIELPVVTIVRDTTVVRDTISGKVLPPVTTIIKRVDTVRLQINPVDGKSFKIDTTTRQSKPDTSTAPRIGQSGEVLIPITSKVYKTDDYRAVISGWRPNLDTIEVYGTTRTITENRTEKTVVIKRPWLALVAGGGVGYTPQKTIVPYAGITLGVVLWQNK